MYLPAPRKLLVALAMSAICLPQISLAHHSAVAFDRSETLTVSGTVTKFVWRNPHLSISIDVEKDGKTERWLIEGGSPTEMVTNGFTRDSMSVGDKITVLINPLKSRKPGGLLQGMTLANGTTFGMEYAETPAVAAEAPQQIPSLTPYVPPPADDTWQKREARTRPPQLPIPSKSPNPVLGVLDAENLAKPRPKPPFDLTGTWAFRGEDAEQAHYGRYEFKPNPEFTEKGKKIYEEYLSYATRGERYAEPTVTGPRR